MPRLDLLRTTVFRLSLIWLALFVATGLLLLGSVWWITTSFIQNRIKETIDVEITGLSDQYRDRGIIGLIETIRERSAAERERRSLYLLTDPRLRPLAGNLVGWPDDVEADAEGWLRFPAERLGSDEGRVSGVLARRFDLPGNFHLVIGRSLADAEDLQRAVAHAIGWGMAWTVVVGLVGAVVASRQMVARVEAVTRALGGILAGDMARRLPVLGNGDEFDRLAEGLNTMLAEIERLVAGMKEVTDNIAHDLRTPLNRLRSRIDVALLGEPDAATLRRVLEETLDEADRLLGTFNALLTIAQAEAGTRVNGLVPLDLGALAHGVVDLYEPLAEDKGLRLELREPATGVMVLGDRHLLSQALANLVDNAVKYTPAGGAVAVTVDDGAIPTLAVADSGPGIPADQRDKVLERFVRLDATRNSPGNGLGLSLVRAVAGLHGAQLVIDDNNPGLVVRMSFIPAPAATLLALAPPG